MMNLHVCVITLHSSMRIQHVLGKDERIMKISTVKGTNDWLPKEAALRNYLQNTILKTY